jgi:hypothetical protein
MDKDKDKDSLRRLVALPYETDSWVFTDDSSETKPFDLTTYNALTGKTTQEAYNPDQPRDPDGRWGSGGGGGDSSSDSDGNKSWKTFWDEFEFKSDAKAPGVPDVTGHEKSPEKATGSDDSSSSGSSEPESTSSGKSFDEMSTEEKEQHLEENGGEEWRNSLSDAERSAITNYSDSGYFTMQDVLRGDAKGDKYWNAQIKDATSGLMKGKSPEDMTVTRVTGAAELKLIGALEGEDYVARGFTSTTIDSDFRKPSLMRMQISIPKGSPGAYVASISGHPDEREWLLPPNAKFRVDSVSGNNAKLTYVGVHTTKKGR